MAIAAAFTTDGVMDINILEKSTTIGGVWSHYGNSFSRVNVSGPGYKLPTSRTRVRASIMHPYHNDILADALDIVRTHNLADRIHLKTQVSSVVSGQVNRCWTVSGLVDGILYWDQTHASIPSPSSASRSSPRRIARPRRRHPASRSRSRVRSRRRSWASTACTTTSRRRTR